MNFTHNNAVGEKTMDLLNKIGQKANRTYNKTMKFTGNITRQARLKWSMADLKSTIDEIYLSIGEQVYRKFILDGEASEELKSECEEIGILAEEVEYLRMEILKLKSKKQCENCHTEINVEFKFCPICGTNA